MNRKLSVASLVTIVASPLFALIDPVYVNSGLPDYTGHDGSTPAKALATVQQGVDAAAEGAVVHVAAGVYSNGVTAADTTHAACRVYVPRSMTIKGAGRDVTHLVGEFAATAAKTGTTAVAGFVIASAAAATRIEGFTIRDCADSKESDNGDGQGTAVRFQGGTQSMALSARPWVVDCAVSNIYACVGAVSYVNVARTIFMNCVGHNFASVADYSDLVYCIVAHEDQRKTYTTTKNNHPFRGNHGDAYGNRIVNCTVVDSSDGLNMMSTTGPYYLHNSIVDYPSGIFAVDLDCCVFGVSRSGFGSASVSSTNETATSTFDHYDKVIASVVDSDFRPIASAALVVGAATNTFVSPALGLADTNNLSYFPEEFRWKDVYGAPVVANAAGKIHAGAVQTTMTPVAAFTVGSSDHNNAAYLRVNGRALCRNNSRTTFTDVWPKLYRLEGMTAELARDNKMPFFAFKLTNDGYLNRTVFPDSNNRWPYVPSYGRLTTVEPMLATHNLYVDRAVENGSASTGSGTAAAPYARLQKAIDSVSGSSGNRALINVAKGTYDCDRKTLSRPNPDCRIFLDKASTSYRLVGTEGAEKTIIPGAADPNGDNGCLSTNAIRCVHVGDAPTVCLQGFTLTGGHTAGPGDTKDNGNPIEASNSYGRGGALLAMNSKNAWLVECIVTNNVGYFGGATFANGNAVRCRFADNDISSGSVFDTQNTDGHWMLTSCLIEQTKPLTAASGMMFNQSTATPGYAVQCTVHGNASTYLTSTQYSYSFLINNIFWSAKTTTSIKKGYRRLQGDYLWEYDYKSSTGDTLNGNFYKADPQFADGANGDYRLLRSSPAYGGGDAWTLMGDPSYPSSWTREQAYKAYYSHLSCDLEGNWPEFVNGNPSAGAYQVPVDKVRVTTTVPNGVNSSAPATQVVDWDAPLTISAANARRQVLGFTVNGVFSAGQGGSLTFTPSEIGANTCAVAVVANTNWYVAANGGSDANTGWTEATAFHTLTGVLAVAERGDVVTALPGVYDEGSDIHTNSVYYMQYNKTNDTIRLRSRAVVPDGVTLVSRDGPEATIIKGEFGEDAYGCGEGAMRCVALNRNSILRGFTLTGGGTLTGTTDWSYEFFDNVGGGAIITLAPPSGMSCGGQPVVTGYAENCIISNNAAHGAGVAYFGSFVHCLVVKNRSLALRECNFVYDCVIGDNDTRSSAYANHQPLYVDSCTFLGNDHKHDGTVVPSMYSYPNSSYWVVRNSLFLGPKNNTLKYLFNCRGNFAHNNELYCWEDVSAVDDATIDESYRPALTSSAVDAWVDGRTSVSNLFHYVTPAALVRETDFAGGQRVYNGRRDIGAGETDWRPQYGATLGVRGRNRVTAATTNVVETASGVTLANAQELSASLQNVTGRAVDCEWQVTVPNGGTLTATVNGVTTTVPSGTFAHKMQVGATDVSFAYAGEGAAVLRSFRRLVGMAIIVR